MAELVPFPEFNEILMCNTCDGTHFFIRWSKDPASRPDRSTVEAAECCNCGANYRLHQVEKE